MHGASQALYNIYQCMQRVQRADDFFEKVRVFSLVLNAEKLIARIHRARRISPQSQNVEFLYDDICEIFKYNRDQVSLLIRTILMAYAKPKLFPILKETYQDIAELFARETEEQQRIAREKEEQQRINQQEEQSAQRKAGKKSKRKADNSSKPSNKRPNTRQSAPQPTISPGDSFGLNSLHTSDNPPATTVPEPASF